jgi:lysophospholipase L1-like esterase
MAGALGYAAPRTWKGPSMRSALADPHPRVTRVRSRFVYWLILILIPVLTAELGAYIFVGQRPEYFSHSKEVLRRLEAQLGKYPEFLRLAYDPVLGWDNTAGERTEVRACNGRTTTITTGPDHARRTPAVDGGPEVLLFGDSYTQGWEVNDDETFAWRLSERLGVQVRNYGVGGYSPLQATLKYERMADAHPRARVAVLGIMHTGVKRMLSRYRGLDVASTGQLFGFKPYMRDGRIMPNPNGPTPVPAERLPDLARAALAEDYFARPEPRFPFSLRVAQLLANGEFYRELAESRSRTFRQYFTAPEIIKGLATVVGRFIAAAEQHGTRPVIAFIPPTRFDREDAAPALAALGARFGGRATFSAVGEESGNWARYNIKDADCHPSAYGHEIIAAHLARVIGPLLGASRAPYGPA